MPPPTPPRTVAVRPPSRGLGRAALAALLFVSCAPAVLAQEGIQAGTAMQAQQDLAKQLANPVASLVSVPFAANWQFGLGPEDQTRHTLNIQPVLPFGMNDDWNVILRVITPVISQPSLFEGMAATVGIGDQVVSAFFSPAHGGLIWGVGPVFLLPVSSDPGLGSGKWGAGPTFVVLKQFGAVTAGALLNHIVSFAGDEDRGDVNASLVQPFVSYATKTGWSFGVNSESAANWERDGDRWLVPIAFSLAKVVRLGKRPISFSAGPSFYPWDDVPSWRLNLGMTLIFPK